MSLCHIEVFHNIMQFNIIFKSFINVFCMRTETYIMPIIRYNTLCPHSRYPRVVQSATCPVRKVTSLRVV